MRWFTSGRRRAVFVSIMEQRSGRRPGRSELFLRPGGRSRRQAGGPRELPAHSSFASRRSDLAIFSHPKVPTTRGHHRWAKHDRLPPLNVALVAACPFPAPRGTPIRFQRLAEAVAGRGDRVHVVTYHFGSGEVAPELTN